MGFLDASVVNASTIRGGTRSIATAQHSIPNILTAPSQKVSESVANAIGGVANNVVGAARTAVRVVDTVQQTAIQVARAVDTAQRTAANISKLVGGFGKSADKLFSSSPTSLASGISGGLTGSFLDRSVKSASNMTTLVSDPTKTLLNAKKPQSTSYKIDSLDAGSKAITLSGSVSSLGSGSVKMTGTSESTLINRFNLDGPNNLGSSIGNKLMSDKVGGLFSTISNIASTTRQVAGDVTRATSKLMNTVYAVKREYDAVVGVVNNVADTASAFAHISSLNDLADFSNQVGNLAGSLGNLDLSSYYMVNSAYSLVDEADRLVETYGSGIDAATANALVAAMKRSGCYTGDRYYQSASGRASMFNVSMSIAGRYGMTGELGALLGCSHAGSRLGQDAMTRSFKESVGSQLPAADLILRSIKSPTSLNTPEVARNLFSNPNLSGKDVGTVNGIFDQLGTTTGAAFSVPGASSTRYPVYDFSLLQTTQPAFINSVFQDTTFTDVFAGATMNTLPDGGLGFI
jgi:hypothetical protein